MLYDDPWAILVAFGLSVYAARLWLNDYRKQQDGKCIENGFPGAYPCTLTALGVAVGGSLFILGIETWGEYALGINEEQKTVTFMFLLLMIAAAFIEELVFRGYVVVKGHGKVVFIVSIVGFSFLFACLHPYLWHVSFPEGEVLFWQIDWHWDVSLKGIFSTGIVWVNALWFYTVRFYALNPKHSLLPCFAAHLSSNLGVFIIKMMQGYVIGFS